jgi:hypothetical protein
MKRFASLLMLGLLAVPAALAQDTTQQTTTTTTQGTADNQTTTTRTNTNYDNDDSGKYSHGAIGVFGEMLRIDPANLNMYGVGGRLSFGVHRNVWLEAEGAYDFEQTRSADITFNGVTSTAQSRLRTTSFLFGPTIHNNGAFQVFGTVKGGLLNFSTSTAGAPAGFTGAVNGIPNGDTNGAMYFGGGVALNAGWFGVRADVGDLMYFQDGSHSNFRFSVGPQIRF